MIRVSVTQDVFVFEQKIITKEMLLMFSHLYICTVCADNFFFPQFFMWRKWNRR